jgi:hypothetical protein
MELGEFDLEYLPRPLLKGQALVDFISEFINVEREERSGEADFWIIDVDGSANKRSNGAGVVVKPLKGQELKYAIRMGFKATNNEAKYEVVLVGLV